MKTAFLSFVLLGLTTSSFAASGDEFLGMWERKEFPDQKAKIEKNGDKFLIGTNLPHSKKTLKEFTFESATYKDGELVVNPFQKAVVVKSSGSMLYGSWEYRREKK